MVLFGWVERDQRNVIGFLREENRALKAQLRGRRIRLSDDQRRRLAVLGHQIGRSVRYQAPDGFARNGNARRTRGSRVASGARRVESVDAGIRT